MKLPTIEKAGAIAVKLSSHLDTKEQAFFIAGFQEAIKYLMYNNNSEFIENEQIEQELKTLINCNSMENDSNTPDFLLAEYLYSLLKLFNNIVERREQWYDRLTYPWEDNL